MRLSVLTLLALSACTGLFPPEPTEGDYDVEVSDVDLSDACEEIWGLEASDDDSTSVEVEVSDDEIEFVDNFTCDRDGAEFDCEEEGEEDVDGYDATVVTLQEMSGEWTSATTFEADIALTFSCDGGDCGELSTDCEISATWEGELDE